MRKASHNKEQLISNLKKIKLFIYGFAPLFLVFCLIGGAVIYYEGYTPSEKTNQGYKASEYSAEAPSYYLVVGTDRQNESFMVFNLVNISGFSESINIVSIPKELAVLYKGKQMSLGEAYKKGGKRAALNAVEDCLSINISRIAGCDLEDFSRMFNYLGGVFVDLPAELNNEEGERIYYQGRQFFKGEDILELFRKACFNKQEESYIFGCFIADIINNRLKSSSQTNQKSPAVNLFDFFITDYSYFDYVNSEPLITAILKKEKPARVYPLYGGMDSSGHQSLFFYKKEEDEPDYLR